MRDAPPRVTVLSDALPRYFVRFYDQAGPLWDVSVAVDCPQAAYDAAAAAAEARFGYVPAADLHSIH